MYDAERSFTEKIIDGRQYDDSGRRVINDGTIKRRKSTWCFSKDFKTVRLNELRYFIQTSYRMAKRCHEKNESEKENEGIRCLYRHRRLGTSFSEKDWKKRGSRWARFQRKHAQSCIREKI